MIFNLTLFSRHHTLEYLFQQYTVYLPLIQNVYLWRHNYNQMDIFVRQKKRRRVIQDPLGSRAEIWKERQQQGHMMVCDRNWLLVGALP